MKTGIILVLVAVLLAVGCLVIALRGRAQAQTAKSSIPPKEVFEGLRNQALKASRQTIGLSAPPISSQAWGIVMDWGMVSGTATIVAFSDGSASIYLSSGGGFIGAGKHESVRNAAKQMVSAAVECQQLAHPTNTYPLPARGKVNFYFLTDSGVLAASASEADLSQHRSPLATLGEAGQGVITQYRSIQQ
jgi:hypothetical protein